MKSGEKYGNIIYYGLLGIIMAFSFFNFSPVYYYFLNPDHAVHILMTANFRFPHDLYFWGQDRLGSFIPLLGHLILKATGMTAVWAVSVSNYLVLIAGWFSISTLFTGKGTKLVLAMFWFLPPLNFLDFLMIAQPFGIEMSLLAISIFIYNKIKRSQSVSKQILLTSLISIILIISLWVSDLTVISIALLISLTIYDWFKHQKSKNILRQPGLYAVFFWIIAGFLFITFAKGEADKDIRYSEQLFNGLHYILLTVRDIFLQTYDILTFNYEDNIYLGFFGWLSLFTVLASGYYFSKIREKVIRDKWFWFFLAQTVLSIAAVHVSHWVFRNGVSRRYFVLIYISFVITILLITDKSERRQQTFINILLTLTAIAAALSSTVHIYYPERQVGKYEEMKEFKRLGKAGIIAEYWNSYITAVAAPDKITATPNDKSYVRNTKMADSVFRQPDLYIIKDSWLDSFPDRIDQFGYRLQQSGKPFELGGASLCEYKVIKIHDIYTFPELKTSSKTIITRSNSKSGFTIQADSSIRYKYLVYGPFVTLNKGKYKTVFNLKTSNNYGNKTMATLDVTSDYGKREIAALKVKQSNFTDTTSYHPFELTFGIDSLTKNIEFRVYYTGQDKLWFNKLELLQIE